MAQRVAAADSLAIAVRTLPLHERTLANAAAAPSASLAAALTGLWPRLLRAPAAELALVAGESTPNEGESTPNEGESTPNEGESTPNEGESTPNEEGAAVRLEPLAALLAYELLSRGEAAAAPQQSVDDDNAQIAAWDAFELTRHLFDTLLLIVRADVSRKETAPASADSTVLDRADVWQFAIDTLLPRLCFLLRDRCLHNVC